MIVKLGLLDTRLNNQQPIDLITVAAHEIGHALGLDHTTVSGSLMLNINTGSHRFLGNDDIAGIRSLYGLPGVDVPIQGSANICTSSTYTLSEYPIGTSLAWSVFPSTAATIIDNGTSVTLTPNGSYHGSLTLTVTVETTCGSVDVNKNIWVGIPTDVTKLSHVSFGCTMGEIFAKPALGAEQYEWQVSGAVITDNGGTSYINGSSIFVDPHDNLSSFTVKVRSINSCGTSDWFTKSISMDCSGGPTPLSTTPELDNDASETIVAYPNPAKEQITVKVRRDLKYSESQPTEIHAIRVLDQNSMERQYFTFKQNRTVQTIDISYLTPGLNFLLIYTDTGVVTKKILVR